MPLGTAKIRGKVGVSVQAAINISPRGGELLQLLRGFNPNKPDFSHLILVSASMLPANDAGNEFWLDFNRVFLNVKSRHQARLFDLSSLDRATLITMNEYTQVAVISDMRVALLRLIQRYFPNHFGMIDQTRLLRVLDLRTKLGNAIAFLERYETGALERPAQAGKLRPLNVGDIRTVEDVSRQLGNADFAKAFIRSQKVARLDPGKAPMSTMHEYFVSMDMLKRHVFKEVELRGSGNLFNQLTITLDQILLSAFSEANPDRERCSINLNVESVFTRGFEEFLEHVDDETFSKVVFEFRQANILQHFDEFEVACNLINGRKGRIAVDSIFPETIGIVNLSRLNVAMAKIFWRQGAETTLEKHRDDIKALVESGTELAIARLDDEIGVTLGQSMGIVLFQGFYVDRLLETRH